jgi:hypothetical protein
MISGKIAVRRSLGTVLALFVAGAAWVGAADDAVVADNDHHAAADPAGAASAPAADAGVGSGRSTIFTDPPSVSAGTSAIPEAAACEKALAKLKAKYKTEYAHGKPKQKVELARTLTDASADAPSDAMRYVMLTEAQRLAAEGDDFAAALDVTGRLVGAFAGTDFVAAEHKLLKAYPSRAEAGAMLTLLDHPHDPAANAVAGRYYCFTLDNWEAGLPLMASGAEKDLRTMAEADLTGDDALKLADQWYELGRRMGGPGKGGMWTRARFYYNRAMNGLDDDTQERVKKNLDAISALVPEPISDWDHLTVAQWEGIHAPIMTVEARFDRSDTGITMAPGMTIRIVPHPTDQWNIAYLKKTRMMCDYRGIESHPALLNLPQIGAVAWQIASADPKPAGLVTGTGELYVMPFSQGSPQGIGSIRIKLLTVKDE